MVLASLARASRSQRELVLGRVRPHMPSSWDGRVIHGMQVRVSLWVTSRWRENPG
jgi:hypothetical protein